MRHDISTLISRLASFAPDAATSTPEERAQFRAVIDAVHAIDTGEERNRQITELAALIADEHMDYLVLTKHLDYIEALERVLIVAAALQERYGAAGWEAGTVTTESARLLGVWQLNEN